jgi:hypothetical protein
MLFRSSGARPTTDSWMLWCLCLSGFQTSIECARIALELLSGLVDIGVRHRCEELLG